MIDAEVLQEVFDEVFSALEAVETQNGAILQFLKDRGIASDEDLVPFREKAAKTSSVRGRAARIRANHLLSGAAKAMELAQEKSRRDTDAKKATGEAAESRTDSDKEAGKNAAGSSGESVGSADAKKKTDDQGPAGGKRNRTANDQPVNNQAAGDQAAKKDPATNKDAA